MKGSMPKRKALVPFQIGKSLGQSPAFRCVIWSFKFKSYFCLFGFFKWIKPYHDNAK